LDNEAGKLKNAKHNGLNGFGNKSGGCFFDKGADFLTEVGLVVVGGGSRVGHMYNDNMSFDSLRSLRIVGVCLLVLGIGFTFWDYREWKVAEMARYGQGWGDVDKPAQELNSMYQDMGVGVRLRLPSSWNASMFKISSRTEPRNLTDVVDERALQIKANRAYIAGNKIDWTVLTWNEELPGGNANVRQEIWGKIGNKLIVIGVVEPEGSWGEVRKTLEEIYKNIEMI
jgi:hypothetical protein